MLRTLALGLAAIAIVGCGGGASGKPDTGSADAKDSSVSDASVDRADVSVDGVDASPGSDGGDAPATTDAADGPGASDAADAPPMLDGSDAIDAIDAADAPVTPAVPYPYLVSGTRLRVNTIQGDDGTILQTVLHDTQIGADCVFGYDASGALRCLPAGESSIAFLDAGCTDAVAVIVPCETSSGWGAIAKGMGSEMFKIGAPIAAPAIIWRLQDAGTASEACVASTDISPSWTFAASTLAPATSFVAGTLSDETRPGLRLGARYIAGADGSKARAAFLDTALGAQCVALRAADGTTRCFGGQPAGVTVFADDRCTEPVVRIFTGTTLPRYVRAVRPAQPGQTCGGVYALREVQAAYQGPLWGGTACAPVTAMGGALYRVGPDLSSTMFVAMTVELRGAGTRLGGFGQRGEDGSVFEQTATALFDRRFGEVCGFEQVAGGGQRCLPYEYGLAGYADATCQTPVYRSVDQSCTWPGAVAIHQTTVARDTCGRASAGKVFGGGAPVTSVFETDGEVCMPVMPAPADVYVEGAAVPLTDFVAGQAGRD